MAAKPLSLEPNPSNPTAEVGSPTLRICSKGCNRATCPRCRLAYGLRKKREALDAIAKIRKIENNKGVLWMWTLTTDKTNTYESPQAAHEDICKNERIRKLAKRMGWKYWSWVLEWHEDGWPHWHVMVYEPTRRSVMKWEVQEVWGHIVEYTRSDKYRGVWGDKVARLAHYLTAYLTKPAKSKTPDWILDSKKRIRLSSSSRAWTAALKCEEATGEGDVEESPLDGDHGSEERLTHREAITRCGGTTLVLKEYVNPLTGEICTEYVGRAEIPIRTVRKFVKRFTDQVKVRISDRYIRMKERSEDAQVLRGLLDPYML